MSPRIRHEKQSRETRIADLATRFRDRKVNDKEHEKYAGICAIMEPDELIEALCHGVPCVDDYAVDLIERTRVRMRIGALPLYGLLSKRPLSPSARARVIAVLGREANPEAMRLLDLLERRASKEDDRRAIRREQIRSRTFSIESARSVVLIEGMVFLKALSVDGDWPVQLQERLPDGRVLTMEVGGLWRQPRSICGLSAGTEWQENPDELPQLSLGQTATLLDSLPFSQRASLAMFIDRFRDTMREPVPRPTPTAPLPLADARALVLESGVGMWRPFRNKAVLKASSLVRASTFSPDEFPGMPTELEGRAASDASNAVKNRRFAFRVTKALEFTALRGHLLRDTRAGSIASAAIETARGRSTPLLQALAESELLRCLWMEAPLPVSWLAQLHTQLATLGRGAAPSAINEAQAIIERNVRIQRAGTWLLGLPDPSTLDLGGALADAMRDRTESTPPI